MATQDRTGTKYEQLLVASLNSLGYIRDGVGGLSYLHPGRNQAVVIPGTFIQPDIVVRNDGNVTSVIYSTHWSNTRDSKRKYWRTWEEQAQQKLVLGNSLLSINCVFEALPVGSAPMLITSADELPIDETRGRNLPLQLKGWDPGIGWAMVESFDVTLLFPSGYKPAIDVKKFSSNEHDIGTTKLLIKALACTSKIYLGSQWDTLRAIRRTALADMPNLVDTKSRYRIGLLHLYVLYRIAQRGRSFESIDLSHLVRDIASVADKSPRVDRLAALPAMASLSQPKVEELFITLSKIPVRKGKNAKPFVELKGLSSGGGGVGHRSVHFNGDLKFCLRDLVNHLAQPGFMAAVLRAFDRFDMRFGVSDALDDLASLGLVKKKEAFVRENFSEILRKKNVSKLGELLFEMSFASHSGRASISPHTQNWVLEMLLYLAGLNSTEDIQVRFKEFFEASGHKLRPHAPYGGHAQTVAFMLQGRDLTERWSSTSRSRTLDSASFVRLAWQSVADAIVAAFNDRTRRTTVGAEDVIRRYIDNKAMRLISSDLNGFEIMIDHFLGDLCLLSFDEDSEDEGCVASDSDSLLSLRVQRSWQTEIVQELWGGRPLETWLEGVAKNGSWLIKVQSAQDGNEGHKTKELSGRSRAMCLVLREASEPKTRARWHFQLRDTVKRALVIDGDWSVSQKQNLYEAGWTWVGDVSELPKLRALIEKDTA